MKTTEYLDFKYLNGNYRFSVTAVLQYNILCILLEHRSTQTDNEWSKNYMEIVNLTKLRDRVLFNIK